MDNLKRKWLESLLKHVNWTFIENANGQIKLFAKNGQTYDYEDIDDALDDVISYFEDGEREW